ncbi:uncharacterized protein LOC115966500 [Quercus lobata]|uniref:uncharacterized protein LOC115966500 n=1 Tax=Quercus lobata TaxID=97700 RepID=UPI001247832A|nr:uncharacterized protein LOC115966500 [Quercus lobata]
MNSDYKSEELLSLDESSSSSEHSNDSSDGETPTAEVDNFIRRSRYPIFRPVAKAENFRLEKDMLFLSPKQFKDAMIDYAVHGGRSYRNLRCIASYIERKLIKSVRRQLDIRLKDIQDAMHKKYVVDISFNQLWEYCDELRRCSWSTVLMNVHTYNDGNLATEHDLATRLPYFERIYIYLEDCKKGFLAGCRPIIGLDACHLKTKTGGQLMCAVGRDPNDEYFPFAYAVVKLECIKLYLMTRFQANRQMIMKEEFELCPKIRKRLYKEKLACSKWLAFWASCTKFEVKNGLESFTVDLEKKRCSCRKWDITGIPCYHAIFYIFFNKEDFEKYVNACYKKTTYIDCYDPIIELINGQNMWRPSGLPPIQPPIRRRPPSRTKKKRALEPDEPRSHRKNRSVGISKQCKAYGKLGHNRRSYKGEVGGNSSLPGSASQVSRTTKRLINCYYASVCACACAYRQANSPAVGSAQPGSNAQPTVHRAQPSSTDDVTTTAPPPPTDN